MTLTNSLSCIAKSHNVCFTQKRIASEGSRFTGCETETVKKQILHQLEVSELMIDL